MNLWSVTVTTILDGDTIVADPIVVTRRRIPTEVDAALQNERGRCVRIEVERYGP